MQVPYYSIEVISTTGKTIDMIDRPISLAAARSFGTVGNATITLPPDLPENIFQFNLRFKIWRTGHSYTPHLFGDTVWLLRRFRNAVSAGHHVIEAVDAMALLGHPVVAYTAQTPYADKTLEENQDVVFDESYRIDNLMRQYVRENMGPDALDTNRRNAYIVVEEDTNFGPYGEKQAAWAKLDSVLSDLARMSAEKGTELFYDLIPHNEQFLFRVWKDVRGRDRGIHSLNSLVFSDDMNDLDEIEVVDDYSNMGTYCYALGYDSGPSQIVVEMSNEEALRADPFGRVEFTTNASDSDVESVLEATAQAAIFGRRPRRTISAKLAGGALMLYGDQFVYGDKVGVQALGRKYNCQVNAVATRWEDGEENLEVRLNGSEELFAPSWRRDNWFVPPQHPEDTTPDPDPDPEPTPDPIPPPSSGLVGGQEQVAAVNLDGYIYRTNDFQTLSSAGGPTWDRVDTGIAETLYSWVVDPFSPGYIDGAGAINGWIASENAIYRVTDIFGTPIVAAVHTFDTAAAATSYHWRSIQASFGTYFPEGGNPWLLCISYYGATSGHSGTWATYSIDGGATWSNEVLVSSYYAEGTPQRFNPIGVYASPKTPGLAYTAAHSSPVDNSSEPLPLWALVNEFDTEPQMIQAGANFSHTTQKSATNTGASPISDGQWYMLMAPPANAVRVRLQCSYSATRTRTNSFSGSNTTHSIAQKTVSGHAVTTDLTFDTPAYGTTITESYFVEWTTAQADWPGNRDTLLASPPGAADVGDYCRFVLRTSANSISSTSVGYGRVTVSAAITEIELDDGTIYTPDSVGIGAGFMSTDWGETWTQLETEPEDSVDAPLPAWWTWEDQGTGSSPIFYGLDSRAGIVVNTYSETNLVLDKGDLYLLLAPPANTKRIALAGTWTASRAKEGTLGTSTVNISIDDASSTTMTHDFVFTFPPVNAMTNQSFSAEITFANYATQDWPINRNHNAAYIEANLGSAIRFRVTAESVQAGGQWNRAAGKISIIVTEIELDDGTIYTPPLSGGLIRPGDAQAGSIHLPWPDNDDEAIAYYGHAIFTDGRVFQLHQSTDGIIEDISPIVSGVNYGPNRYGFSIRTHDSNRQYLALAGIGSEGDIGNPDNDLHAVFVSSDYGATWTNIITPIEDSSALSGRPAFEVAFGGDSASVLYIWGPPDRISYSGNFGATVDIKTGNLAALNGGTLPSLFIGICGGPTA